MNYFLLVLILGISGVSYYEYTTQQETIASNDQEINDLTTKAGSLEADNKKLEDDIAQLTKDLSDNQAKLADAQAKISSMTPPVQATSPMTTSPASVSSPGAPATPASAPPTNSLGTIVTVDGKTFTNCVLLKVEADGITFKHATGITKVLYPYLSADLQKRFEYEPPTASTSGN